MQFLNPLMLWGLLAVSVPIAIHLLNRFRYREIDWAAMELLRRALVVRSRRIRMEDWILLLLRCAAIMLLALALSRPTIRPESGAGWLGEQARVGAVIAIDGSFSMEHRPGVHSRFDQAVSRAREVLSSFKSGDVVTLAVLGRQPRVLLRNVAFDKQRLETLLGELRPLPEGLQLETSLERLGELLDEMDTPLRECHLLSDGQRVTWENLSDRTQESLRRLSGRARTLVFPVVAEHSENVAITDFELESGTLHSGSTARYAATLSNLGTIARENVLVRLQSGGQVLDERIVDRLEPATTQVVPLYGEFPMTGSYELQAVVSADELTMDDTRHVVAEVRPEPRVLVVDAGSADGLPLPTTESLLTALAPQRFQSDATQRWERVAASELGAVRFGDYELVVLSDVPDVPERSATALNDFVSRGGGLIVLLGAATKPTILNARLGQLMPAVIGEPAGADAAESASESDGHALQPVAARHTLASAWTALSADLLDEVRVRQWFAAEPVADAVNVLRTEAGAPFLLERGVGRGRVVLFTSQADPAWTDMVGHPLFPILIHESVSYLSRRPNERPLLVGQEASVALPDEAASEELTRIAIARPDGTTGDVPVVRESGVPMARLAATERAGFYRIQTGGTSALSVAANVDPAESDVRVLNASELGERLSSSGVQVVSSEVGVADAIRESRTGRELWWDLALAAVTLLLIEAFCAWWFTNRAEVTA